MHVRDLERDPPPHEALQALHGSQELYPPRTVNTKAIDINKVNYYIDASVLMEQRPLIKFIRNYIRDRSGVFSISSQ